VFKWTKPATGVPNDYHLYRKRSTEAEFSLVDDVGFIAGDDQGLRKFVWDTPLDLACGGVELKVEAEDVFGRPGPASASVSVPRQRLIPQNPRGEGPRPDLKLRVSWDDLPTCGPDPNHMLREYIVMRTLAPVSNCSGTGPDPNTYALWVEAGRAPAGQNFFDVSAPFPTHRDYRFWYRIKARWGSNDSTVSEWADGICASHSTGQQSGVLEQDESGTRLARSPELAGDEPEDRSAHRLIGQSGTVNPPVKMYFFHLDHLGSVRVVTDVVGQPVSKHKYLPFGEELDPPATSNTHKFTGHERDGQTGLDYMKARFYSPILGRFGSVDPSNSSIYAGIPQTWNRYSYVFNNPANKTDPTGTTTYPPENADDLPDSPLPSLGAIFGALIGALVGDVRDAHIVMHGTDPIGGEKVPQLIRLAAVVSLAAGPIISTPMQGGKGKGDLLGSMSEMHRHHTVPREILKQLPGDVANNPLVRGRAGAPNRWSIPKDLHESIHRGPGGGAYNEAFKQRLSELGRNPSVEDVLRIRDDLVKQFGLEGYRP
jgi:RHS repeat-associated protein